MSVILENKKDYAKSVACGGIDEDTELAATYEKENPFPVLSPHISS